MKTKKALGRGLSQLIPELEKEISLLEKSEKFLEIKFLPLDKIKFSTLQVRKEFKEDETFKELVLSIKEKGILQPILVRPLQNEFYECVAGERRLRACISLGLKEIPSIIRDLSDEEVILIGLIENVQRKNLSPIEEAIAYKTLIEKFGYTQEEVAEKVGKDRATVANLLRLLKLPSLIQEDLLEGRLTVGHAKALLSLNSEKDQLFLRDILLEKELSVRETEKYIKRFLNRNRKILSRTSFKEPEEKFKNFIEELGSLINTKIKVKINPKKTYFIFEFEDHNKAENFLYNLQKLFKNLN